MYLIDIMISDSSLQKVSLILAITGIIALLLISQGIEPRSVAIGDITSNLIGYQVSASGYVKDFYWHDGHFFATLSENREQIKIVMFERDAKKFPALSNVSKNSNLLVMGSVNEYEGELEIVAKEIKII